MVVFRCTQKLRRRMGHSAPTQTPSAKSSGRLGDWYANAVSVHRRHVVLAVSGVTLVPVLVEAAPYKTMTSRFVAATGEVLRALGVPDPHVAVELDAMRELVMAPTNDRRVLGSLNDFIRMLDSYLDERSLTDVALHLAEAPCGPIGMKSPRDATLALFSGPALRLVKG